jgi:hypothetical protein
LIDVDAIIQIIIKCSPENNMTDYSGFLIKFDEPKRAHLLRDRIEGDFVFSESLSAPDWETKAVEVCLLCFEGAEIDYAALAVRRGKSATAKYRVEFSNFVEFEPPLRPEEVEQVLGEQYSQYLINSTSGAGGRVPPKTWLKLVDAIRNLRRDKTNEFNRLIDLRLEQSQTQSGFGFEVMAQEKDATGLALEFSEFDRRTILPKNYRKADKPAPFLEGLEHVDVLEDSMIFHDMRVFGDWKEVVGAPAGAATFEKNEERVTIVNANRTSLEKTLGVDLIYYHDRFKSYVMVQYKRMEKAGQDWVYRPDEQLDEEMKRMRGFQAGNSSPVGNLQTIDYRLHPGMFYLKLCQERVFAPYSPDLIKGMYLPIEYFDVLKTSTEMRGRDNGLRIAWNETTRYMNNTLFIDLVRDGWIGARTITSDKLTEIIRNSLEGNRSLLLAKKTSRQV